VYSNQTRESVKQQSQLFLNWGQAILIYCHIDQMVSADAIYIEIKPSSLTGIPTRLAWYNKHSIENI